MRRLVSITAGKPEMTGRKRSCTSQTSSAVSSGASLPTLGRPAAAAVAMARTAARQESCRLRSYTTQTTVRSRLQ